jgi:hypothetical protein
MQKVIKFELNIMTYTNPMKNIYNILGVLVIFNVLFFSYKFYSNLANKQQSAEIQIEQLKSQLESSKAVISNYEVSYATNWFLLRNKTLLGVNFFNNRNENITLHDENDKILALFVSNNNCSSCFADHLGAFINLESEYRKYIIGYDINLNYLFKEVDPQSNINTLYTLNLNLDLNNNLPFILILNNDYDILSSYSAPKTDLGLFNIFIKNSL